MTKEDIDDFYESIQFILTFLKRYFNRISFLNGIELPLDFIDLTGNIEYQSDAILFLFDVSLSQELKE